MIPRFHNNGIRAAIFIIKEDSGASKYKNRGFLPGLVFVTERKRKTPEKCAWKPEKSGTQIFRIWLILTVKREKTVKGEMIWKHFIQ